MPRRDLSRVRHAQRAQPGLRPGMRRATGRVRDAAPAWHGRGAVPRCGPATRCASMRRSARTRTCSPTWCAGCWRTAPTPASCIAWSIRRCPKRRSSPIRWTGCARSASAQSAHSPAARSLSGPRNSAGVDLADRATAPALLAASSPCRRPVAMPDGAREIRSPADRRVLVGAIDDAEPARDRRANSTCSRAAGATGMRRVVPHRAAVLERAADLIEACARRIAVPAGARRRQDAGRWHRRSPRGRRLLPLVCAARARQDFAAPRELPGPTGERNTWALGGRGVFAAISPWNFPLAIFTGQVAAALAAGNAVAAKPAEQTPLVAARAVALLLEAGVPRTALALLPGDGTVGQALVQRSAHRRRRVHRRHRDRAGDRDDRSPRVPARSFRSSPKPAASTR